MMASAANKAVVSGRLQRLRIFNCLNAYQNVFSYPTDMLILQLGNKQG
jgi:hypothetical protein